MTANDWQPIETAPRDGSGFIIRNADHPSFGSQFCVRNVRHRLVDGRFITDDLGGWLMAGGIEPDYDDGDDVGGDNRIPTIIAPDKLNTSVRYEWAVMPGTRP